MSPEEHLSRMIEEGGSLVESEAELDLVRAIEVGAGLIERGLAWGQEVSVNKPHFLIDRNIDWLLGKVLSDDDVMVVEKESNRAEIGALTYVILERMQERARFQREYKRKQTALREEVWSGSFASVKLAEAIRESGFRESDCQIEYGMFTYGLVMPPGIYDVAQKFFGLDDTLGFVTNSLRSRLGMVPVVKAGKYERGTMWHEEVHVIQGLLASRFGQASVASIIQGIGSEAWDAFERSVVNDGIRSDDISGVEECVMADIIQNTIRTTHELQASLWEGQRAGIPMVSVEAERLKSQVVHDAVMNIVFSPAIEMSDEERVDAMFEWFGKMSVPEIIVEYIYSAAQQSVESGRLSWSQAAARVLATPVMSPLPRYRRVLLGEQEFGYETVDKMELELVSKALALVSIVRARRVVNPGSSGAGGVVLANQVPQFLDELKGSRGLAEGIMYRRNRGEELTDQLWQSTLGELVRWAVESVERGAREGLETRIREAIISGRS